MKEIYDNFKIKLESLDTWSTIDSPDKTLPDYVKPTLLFKSDDQGNLGVISKLFLKMKMTEVAALFKESDITGTYIKTSEKQTFTLIGTPKPNIISV